MGAMAVKVMESPWSMSSGDEPAVTRPGAHRQTHTHSCSHTQACCLPSTPGHREPGGWSVVCLNKVNTHTHRLLYARPVYGSAGLLWELSHSLALLLIPPRPSLFCSLHSSLLLLEIQPSYHAPPPPRLNTCSWPEPSHRLVYWVTHLRAGPQSWFPQFHEWKRDG